LNAKKDESPIEKKEDDGDALSNSNLIAPVLAMLTFLLGITYAF